jgi:hypothetical protein
MTDGLAYLASIGLALVFAYSAAAKFRDGHATRRAMNAVGMRGGGVTARALPVIEAAIALTLLVRPNAGGFAAIVLLSVFTVFIAYLLLRKIDVSCGCFGANATKTVSSTDVIRNVMLMAVAAIATTTATPTAAGLEEVIAATTAAAIGVVILVAVGTRRELGQLFDNRLPGER